MSTSLLGSEWLGTLHRVHTDTKDPILHLPENVKKEYIYPFDSKSFQHCTGSNTVSVYSWTKRLESPRKSVIFVLNLITSTASKGWQRWGSKVHVKETTSSSHVTTTPLLNSLLRGQSLPDTFTPKFSSVPDLNQSSWYFFYENFEKIFISRRLLYKPDTDYTNLCTKDILSWNK